MTSHVATFARRLALVVLAAGLSVGCCEVMHLGWARSYGPRDYRELRSVDARSLAKARVLENGRLDASSCNALCGATDDLEVVACRPVTVAFPPSATRVLVCDFGSGVEPRVKVTLSRAEAASSTSSGTGELPIEACRSRCTRGGDEVQGCSLEPEPWVSTQPTSPTVPLLACAYHKPGGCGSPVLSRHEGEAPATAAARAKAPRGTCTGVPDPLGDEKTVD
jgi:hypothetical protein